MIESNKIQIINECGAILETQTHRVTRTDCDLQVNHCLQSHGDSPHPSSPLLLSYKKMLAKTNILNIHHHRKKVSVDSWDYLLWQGLKVRQER